MRVAEKSGAAGIFSEIESPIEALKESDNFLTMTKMTAADLEIIGGQNCAIAKFRKCYVSDRYEAIVQERISN
jgi:hypothetical protein